MRRLTASRTAGAVLVFAVALGSCSDTPATSLTTAPETSRSATPASIGDLALTQTISFTSAVPSLVYVGGTHTVSATATSGDAVTFSSLTAGTCSVAGATVSFLGAGTCTVAADQAGNATYQPAPQVTQDIVVTALAGQSISFLTTPPSPAYYATQYQPVAAGGASGNPVVFTSLTPAFCTMQGTAVSLIGLGICTVAANQAGGAAFEPAPQVTQSFAIDKRPQTLAFTTEQLALAIVGDLYLVGAQSTSLGQPGAFLITFTSLTPITCDLVSINVVKFLAAGTCTVAANSEGSATIEPAAQITQNIVVRSANVAPALTLNGPYSGEAGSAIALTLSASDPDANDVLSFTWAFGDGTIGSGTILPSSHTYAAAGNYTISVTANDGRGGIDSKTALVAVAPQAVLLVGPVTVPLSPTPLTASVTAWATVTTPRPGATQTGSVQWDTNGPFETVGVTISGGRITASRTLAPGVYTITLKVTETGNGSSSSTATSYTVVYDPAGGFVTGRGWILAPAGACAVGVCGFTGAGMATFGFVSKYAKGATIPSGTTEFEFKQGTFTFTSLKYEWLVIAGDRAQYKGDGAVNGTGGYGFLLTGVDGAVRGGPGVDAFRIKVWNKATGAVVYDNQVGEGEDSGAATALGGGSIVLHK